MAMSWAEWAASQPVQYTKTWQDGIGRAARELGFGGSIFSPEYLQARERFYAAPPSHDNGGGDVSDIPVSYNPELLRLLDNYRFQSESVGRHNGVNVSDQAGQSVGTFKVGDTGSKFDDFAFTAIPAGIATLAGAALGGFIPGAEIGAAGNASGGLIGAGEGAAQLAAATSSPLTAAEVVASTLPSGGLPGLSSGLLASVPAEVSAALGAYAANPMTAAELVSATLPSAGLPGLSSGLLAGVPAEVSAALDAYTAANPVTMAEVSAGMPNIAPASVGSAGSAFNAAKDSQAYNQAAGITGDQAAAAATVPKTVNIVGNGGTMATAGGLQGMADLASQVVRDNVPTGLLSDGASWLKDNPTLGRLLLGGATSLLSGGGSSGGTETPSGPPVQWNSPLQQGLLSKPQQYAPPAQTRPAGLLAQGYANDGAWRYMGG